MKKKLCIAIATILFCGCLITMASANNESSQEELTPVTNSNTVCIGGSFSYSYDGITYGYSLEKGHLMYQGLIKPKEVADNVRGYGFIENYVIYWTWTSQVYVSKLGETSSKQILESFETITFKDVVSTEVIGMATAEKELSKDDLIQVIEG